MAGVIATPQRDPWKVANWAFQLLLTRVSDESDDESDRFVLQRAMIFQTLDLGRFDPVQRTRLARAVARSAEKLRPELLLSDDPRDQGFATRLTTLALALNEDFG
ncbi:MAG TPA: hypothetical protein VKV26_18490 [Dehalococcoidia bacterium]|nr:hypothetical protein [Dehalococcoidia bacterium]